MSLQIPRLNDPYEHVHAVAEMERWVEGWGKEPTDEELAAIGLEPADYYALSQDELDQILGEVTEDYPHD